MSMTDAYAQDPNLAQDEVMAALGQHATIDYMNGDIPASATPLTLTLGTPPPATPGPLTTAPPPEPPASVTTSGTEAIPGAPADTSQDATAAPAPAAAPAAAPGPAWNAAPPPPATPEPVEGKTYDQQDYSPKQKWMLGFATLGDIAQSLVGRDTNQFGTELASFSTANKAAYDAAVAERARAARQAVIDANPNLSTQEKSFLANMDNAEAAKAGVESIKPADIAGGNTYVNRLAMNPNYTATKYGVESGVATAVGPGVTNAYALPPSYANVTERQAAQAKAQTDAVLAKRQDLGISGYDAAGHPIFYNRYSPGEYTGSTVETPAKGGSVFSQRLATYTKYYGEEAAVALMASGKPPSQDAKIEAAGRMAASDAQTLEGVRAQAADPQYLEHQTALHLQVLNAADPVYTAANPPGATPGAPAAPGRAPAALAPVNAAQVRARGEGGMVDFGKGRGAYGVRNGQIVQLGPGT